MDTLTQQDRDHLRVLTILHYVFAGLGLLGIAFTVGHYAMMRTFMNPEMMKHAKNPPPEGFMDMFIWIYVIMGVVIITGMTLNFLATRWLKARKNRTFCFIVAALNTLQVPFGTGLGVFTIFVLARDTVRQAFEPTES